MRIFGDPMRTKRLLQMAGMKEGEVIESGMLTRQIEKAQRKVESHNFDIRKQLLLFDDVANDQRKVIYQQRTEILGTAGSERGDPRHVARRPSAPDRPVRHAQQRRRRTGIWRASARRWRRDFGSSLIRPRWLAAEPELEEAALRRGCVAAVAAAYEQKVARTGAPLMRHVERDVMLRTLDQHWRDHLAAMDYLRQGIHLRGYAQKDYRYEYKREAFELFAAMLDRVKFDTVSMLVEDRGAHPGAGRPRGGGAARAADAGAAGAARRSAVGAGRHRTPARRCADTRGPRGPAARVCTPGTARPRPSCGRTARSAATSPVRAAPARSSSIAMAPWPAPLSGSGSGRGRRAARSGGSGADRAATAGFAHGRPLGISRR